ncbi:hypothetical protein RCL1_003976 [Eukaryota sp. TZLM3-RCL]
MTTSRKAVLGTFFSPFAVNYLELDLQVLTDASLKTCLLARMFSYVNPDLASWTTQFSFWVYAFDCITKPEGPKMCRDFQTDPEGIQVLQNLLYCSTFIPKHHYRLHSDLRAARSRQLAQNMVQLLTDGPITWKLNFFKTISVINDCPSPSVYASCVVKGSNFPEHIAEWVETHHWIIEQLFDILLGGVVQAQRFNSFIEQGTFTADRINSNFLFSKGLDLLLYLEQSAPDQMKRNALTPISSYTVGHVNLCSRMVDRFLKHNQNGGNLLNDPYRHFRVNRQLYPEYSIKTDGVSISFAFSRTLRVGRARRSQDQANAARANGDIQSFTSKTYRRKKNLQKKAPNRPRNRRNREMIVPRYDPFFLAIDPNHTCLCGYTCGSGEAISESNLVWAASSKKIAHPPPLNQLTPNVYTVQGFSQYLIGMQMVDAASGRTILQEYLFRGRRKAVRRVKFDFYIRKQKRFQHFWNRIRSLAGNRPIHTWFGSGGDSPSRQRTKVPRKEFMEFLKKNSDSFVMGDEYMTSAKVYCCTNQRHRKLYQEDEDGNQRVINAYFQCQECEQVISRDISASINQYRIAIAEYRNEERPIPFRRRRNNNRPEDLQGVV